MRVDGYIKLNNNISSVKDYWCLLKPKVMYLVVFTALTGMVCAPGNVDYIISFTSLICIALGSGAAGAINMWYDSDIDLQMFRTKNRPIPSGRIVRENALEFGVVLGIISTFIMAIVVNYISALLLITSIAIYVFLYTFFLKRRTPYNIVIGGAAGSLPPMIGWSSITGDISLECIVLFFIIFMWTPPHFWALSLLNFKEYEKVNIPMMPVVHGVKKTKINIFVYSILMVILTLLPGIFMSSSLLYELTAFVLGGIFIVYATLVLRLNNEYYYKKLFSYSIIYLFLLFFFIMIFSNF